MSEGPPTAVGGWARAGRLAVAAVVVAVAATRAAVAPESLSATGRQAPPAGLLRSEGFQPGCRWAAPLYPRRNPRIAPYQPGTRRSVWAESGRIPLPPARRTWMSESAGRPSRHGWLTPA